MIGKPTNRAERNAGIGEVRWSMWGGRAPGQAARMIALAMAALTVMVISGSAAGAAPQPWLAFPASLAPAPGLPSGPIGVSSDPLIPDPQLLAAIRDALGKPTGPITEEDLQQVTVLEAKERGITDLTGLELCANLSELYIQENPVSDLSPLSELQSLTVLDLCDMKGGELTDLSPLANLRNLQVLRMRRIPVSDLGPLSGLVELRVLWAYALPVTSLEPLSGLTNLTDLRAHHNHGVTSLEPLKSLTNLRSLSCHDTGCHLVAPDVVWMRPLASLVNLESLRLDYSAVSTFEPISGLTNLKVLYATRNPITTLEPLRSLVNLEELYVGGSEDLADIDALTALPKLSVVNIGGTAVESLQPLSSCTSLEWLSAGGNGLTDLAPVETLTNLKRLYVSDNRISDLSPLSELTTLTHLHLAHNQITDIGPLVANTGLGGSTRLDISYNCLDLTPGSSASEDIQALLDRGVQLTYEPQALHFSEAPSGTPNPVASGEQVTCTATATDTRGYEVTYQWAAFDGEGGPAGSFNDASARETVWTAPANTTPGPMDYIVSVTATSEDGTSLTASYTQTVDPQLCLLEAVQVDPTHVKLKFNVRVRQPAAENVENYSISDGLSVLSATLGSDQTAVELCTDAQQEDEEYTVTVTRVRDTHGVPIEAPYNTASWTAPGVPPRVIDAERVDWTQVAVTFNERVRRVAAETLDNYSIQPAVEVTAAQLDETRQVVTLTTAEQAENTAYTVTVGRVKDIAGNLVDPDHNAASWTTPGIPPQVVEASQDGWTGVRVAFDEALDSATAETVGNYSIEPPLTVRAARLGPGQDTVTLATGLHEDNTTYTVTVRRVQDLAGNALDPDHRSASWTTGILPPRVETAEPVGTSVNTLVPIVIAFNKPMDATSTEAAFNIDPDVAGTLSWADGDTTLSFRPDGFLAHATTYTVRVGSGARDAAGTAIEAQHEWSFTTEPWPVFSREFPAGVWMLGVPAMPADPRADRVLGTTQSVRWAPQVGDYCYFADDPFNVSPGTGYWVRYQEPKDLSLQGYRQTLPLNVEVSPGWNLLANPGTETLHWSGISADGDVQRFGWVQSRDGAGYQLVTELSGLNSLREIAPWQAFWLRADEACTVTLGGENASQATGREQSTPKWAVQLAARAGGLRDDDNYVGMTQTAAGLALPNPPRQPGAYVDLYVLEDGTGNAVSLRAADASTSWDVVVETNLAETEIDVRWPDLSPIPEDYAVVLRDLDTGRTLNMRTSASYRFVSGPDGARRSLRFEVRPRASGGPAVVTSVMAHGSDGGLAVVYALSAPACIEIEVLNVAGRRIAIIGEGERDAGRHTAVWSGVSHTGARVPGGRYLVTVRSMSPDGSVHTHVTTALVR